MADIQLFDRLNLIPLEETPASERRSEPYSTYFGDMPITREQAEEREEMAKTIEEAVRHYLLLFLLSVGTGVVMYEYAEERLRDELRENNIGNEDYRSRYAKELTRSTMANLGTPWFFSEDRAIWNAENEANTVLNHEDHLNAIRRGFRHKQWIGIDDLRERPTHKEKNDEVIPIDEYFHVGAAKLLYPKDVFSERSTGASHPEETVNCRCSLVYLP